MLSIFSFKWLDSESLIHSIKTAIACILGFILTLIIGLPDPWIVVTIIVVMCAQIYVGGVMQKSYLRFLGTLVGCLFAILALLLLGHSTVAIAITIGLASLIFSYFAVSQENLGYAGTLGAVTTIIILVGQQPTLIIAAQRFLEISLGILIATCASQFILPIHARTHLRRMQAKTLEQLRDYYQACMLPQNSQLEKNGLAASALIAHQEFDEIIIKSLSKQRQLAKDAAREPLGDAFDSEHFVQSLQCEKEMLRAIDFMWHALSKLKFKHPALVDSSLLTAFNVDTIQSFNTLITIITSQRVTDTNYIQLTSFTHLKHDLRNAYPDISSEELTYLDGFLFAVNTFIVNLATLAKLYRVMIRE
jgi:uncharacterized membrane protein YccC